MANEAAISLQADTISPVPGGPIRTITMILPVNGVPTTVQAQVIALTDANGVVIDPQTFSSLPELRNILIELREMRKLMAIFMGLPVVDSVPVQLAQDAAQPNTY